MQTNPQPAGMAPAPEAEPDFAGQWQNWLGNEANRAALMQFGIALTQPMQWGGNNMSHIGAALGSAGEAAGRQQAAQRADDKNESQMALREAQASNMEARANIAGARAETANTQVMANQARYEASKSLTTSQRLRELRKVYEEMVANPLTPKANKMSWEDYVKNTDPALYAQALTGSANNASAGASQGQAKDGEIRTYNGARYRYDASKGPSNSKSSWTQI